MMSFDNISAIPSLIGGGFLVGAFLGYFIRKVIKIILFARRNFSSLDVSTIPRINYC
jgi:NhaP-type Na+/H+ or K+/H+ antiporter